MHKDSSKRFWEQNCINLPTILASTSFELIHSNQSDSIYIVKLFHILSMYRYIYIYIYNLKL
jgi:hypothetical protein